MATIRIAAGAAYSFRAAQVTRSRQRRLALQSERRGVILASTRRCAEIIPRTMLACTLSLRGAPHQVSSGKGDPRHRSGVRETTLCEIRALLSQIGPAKSCGQPIAFAKDKPTVRFGIVCLCIAVLALLPSGSRPGTSRNSPLQWGADRVVTRVRIFWARAWLSRTVSPSAS